MLCERDYAKISVNLVFSFGNALNAGMCHCSRLEELKLESCVFWERQTLQKGSGVEWSWMSPWGRTMELLLAPGQSIPTFTLAFSSGFSFGFLYLPWNFQSGEALKLLVERVGALWFESSDANTSLTFVG